jgi:hypothetical protein
MKTKLWLLIQGLLMCLVQACRSAIPRGDLTTEEIVGPSLELNWQELVVDDSEFFQPNPGSAFLRENIDTSIAKLHESLRHNRKLAQLVVNRFMDQTMPFQGGVLGKVGDTNVFVAEKRTIPDYDSLHRVIITMLSSRYGCLMRQRRKAGDFQELICRDGRKIEVTRRQGDDWIQFVANQYDRHGALIIVRNHEILNRFATLEKQKI